MGNSTKGDLYTYIHIQYYLGSDIGVTNIPGQQATISGCVDRELEQHLYLSLIHI